MTSKHDPTRKRNPEIGEPVLTPDPDSGVSFYENQGPIEDDRLMVPQRIAAMAFDVSYQALQQWPVKPRVKEGRSNLYYLPDLIRFRMLQKESKTDLDLTAERARLACAQADKHELEVEQMKGNLIPADIVLQTWEPIAGAARAKVLALPSKLKTALPKLNDDDLAKIKTICRGVLEDLANNGIPKSVNVDNRADL